MSASSLPWPPLLAEADNLALWIVLGVIVLIVLVVAVFMGVRFTPDFVRYLRIKKM